MIKSMTGYGQAMVVLDNLQINVEMKSVNHRFKEIAIRMPREFLSLEEPIKKRIGQYVKRGKVDLFITTEQTNEGSNKVHINWSLAGDYYRAYQEITDRFSFSGAALSPVDLMRMPEVLRLEEPLEELERYQDLILQTVDSACQQFLHMRQFEGQYLQEDLTMRIQLITRLVDEIRERSPLVVQHYKERLVSRIKDFLADNGEIDESRLLTEVAVFAEKANIDEELTRLSSHCEQFLTTLNSADSVGRKLDFLVQEMNREINTIGSKANDLGISQRVVDLKAELEKIKEQVQNIE